MALMIGQTLPVAVRALLRNKLRSFLTTLGIIIGVASVISMVGVGEGAKTRVEKAFSSMGTNLLIVLSGKERGPEGMVTLGAGQAGRTRRRPAYQKTRPQVDTLPL